ncbi:MAG: adenylate kinase [Gammaproteobacteria bacterium]|nr:adenylate kinase [Gammaproteobacteria bacterium]
MILIFMGPPGAGKGTQAIKVSARLGIPQISTGDILREAMKNGSELGKKARSFIDSGELVPDEVVTGIISNRINNEDAAGGFLLDGFPRTVEQADALNVMLDSSGLSIDHVINLEVPDDTVRERLLKRAEIENRSDDTKEVITKRLENYHQQTQPLVEYYKAKEKLLAIDGNGSLDEVNLRINSALGV